jgi:hypothetical protein
MPDIDSDETLESTDEEGSASSGSSRHGSKKVKKDIKKKDKNDKKDKKDNKSKKDKKKKKKKDKKDKKDTGAMGAVTNQYGKYGTISTEDMYNKRAEFQAWVVEVKKTHFEGLSRRDEQELFKEFVEDYNTATMPHKKFYNLDAYDKKATQAVDARNKKLMEASKGPLGSFDDEKARRMERDADQKKLQEQQVAAQLARLRSNKDQVADMRHQEALKAQLVQAHNRGDAVAVRRLTDRLTKDSNVGEDGKFRPDMD